MDLTDWCVNALSRAHSISTLLRIAKGTPDKRCVNALSRAHSISTIEVIGGICYVEEVSMPYLGRTPFLPVTYKQNKHKQRKVSMPYLGRTPFLPGEGETMKNIINMCQCPISGALHFYN